LKKKTASRHEPKRTPRPTEVTIDTVAAAANVSTATVSRFFNAPQKLTPRTALRVQTAVNDLGYVPNLLAGGLSSARTQLIAAVIPTVTNSFFSSTIQSISDTLADRGYSVVLALTGASDEHAERQLLSIIGRRPDGIILTGAVLPANARAKLIASEIPTIETWDLPSDPIDMVVGFSHEAVGRAVGVHAAKTGRRKVLAVSAGGIRALARRYGFSKVLLEHGFPEPTVISFPTSTSYGNGRSAVAAHLDAGGRPDLIVCSSDWSAHGALDELRHRGIRVPKDIAVIGFGDSDFASVLDPSLTSVKIDGKAIGQQAAAFLMKRAQGQKIKERIVDVGFELIVRASG
jgi:LacI family gluconate utilization system Gnt-I transcriptional repressor